MEEGTLDKKDAMKARKKGNHFKKKAKRIGKLAEQKSFCGKGQMFRKSPKHPPKAPSLPNVDGDQTNLFMVGMLLVKIQVLPMRKFTNTIK